MKWFITTVSVMLMLAVSGGCEQSPADAQHQSSQAALKQALEQAEEGITGIRELSDQDIGKVQPREPYRQENLAAATKTLQPVLQGVKAAHLVAARELKSEHLASDARLKMRDASIAWTRQGPTTVTMISDLSGIRLARTHIKATEGIGYKDILESMQGQIKSLNQQRDQINSQIAPLEKQIAEYKQTIEQNDAARRKKIAEADKYAREAFKSSGKQRFDLDKLALEATREADKLTAQSDLAAANLDIAQAQMKIFNARLADLDLQIKQLQEAIDSLMKREKDTDELAAKARERAETLLQRFDANLKQLAEVHEKQVTQRFVEANTSYEEAIDDLAAAAQQAEPAYRTSVRISHNATRAEYGASLREEALLHIGYRDLLRDLAAGAADQAPERQQTLLQMADAADKLATEANDKAKEVLAEADAELAEIADTVSDKKFKRAVFRQLAEINRAMAGVTGEESFNQKATDWMTKLKAEETS